MMAAQSSEEPKTKRKGLNLIEALQIVVLILGWYSFSALANVSSKEILMQTNDAMALTLSQLLFKVLFSLMLSLAMGNWQKVPYYDLLVLILPLGGSNFVASWLNQISTNELTVSFNQTVKATSPIFTVFLSYYFLKDKYTAEVVLSLLPIVIGVCLCTASELVFSAKGFIISLASTLVFVLQNIYSKRLFRDHKFDHYVLVFYTSLCALIVLLPTWVFVNAPDSTIFFQISNISLQTLAQHSMCGFAQFMQTLLAFHTLKLVSTTTYSIVNTFKRVCVIVVSVLWFRNEVSLTNGIGIVIAITGVYFYNSARRKQKEADGKTKDQSAGVEFV